MVSVAVCAYGGSVDASSSNNSSNTREHSLFLAHDACWRVDTAADQFCFFCFVARERRQGAGKLMVLMCGV